MLMFISLIALVLVLILTMRKEFFPLRKDAKDSEHIPPQRCFKEDLEHILSLVESHPCPNTKIAILDFSIKVIARHLALDPIVNYICTGSLPSLTPGCCAPANWFCIPVCDGSTKTIPEADLSPYSVVIQPWSKGRLINAIRDISEAGFNQNSSPTDCYSGILYPELELVVITNGKHHLTVAQLTGHATADLTVANLTPFFDTLRTDGSQWYFNGKKYLVGDYRIALLYELARRRAELINGST